METAGSGSSPARQRVDWVDIAKGICIIFVVMLHSALGVEIAMGREGWLHQVIAFARPFRMPDFFLISGLFLGLVIDRPWLRYLDRKVMHFAYFYVLWLTIQFALKAPGMAAEAGWASAVEAYLTGFVQPFGTLWFIYLLPLFFVFTRLVKGAPVWLVLAGAAILEILPVHTGSVILDEFCARYVYFFAGYAFASRFFAAASWTQGKPTATVVLLVLWALVNVMLVFTPAPEALTALLQPDLGVTGATGGWSELPLISLALGFAGVFAVIAVAALLARLPYADWLRWLGAQSIVVYLAFFLPMAVTRTILVKAGTISDAGTVGAIVTAAGVIGSVVLYRLVQWTGYGRFLFERPAWARIEGRASRSAQPVPAE